MRIAFKGCTHVFYLTVLTTVTLTSSNNALPDDGDYTETCWNCFNVNFNTPFKAILLRICGPGPGIKSRWGRDIPHLSRPALGPTQPPVQRVPSLSRG